MTFKAIFEKAKQVKFILVIQQNDLNPGTTNILTAINYFVKLLNYKDIRDDNIKKSLL